MADALGMFPEGRLPKSEALSVQGGTGGTRWAQCRVSGCSFSAVGVCLARAPLTSPPGRVLRAEGMQQRLPALLPGEAGGPCSAPAVPGHV